jgi:hypothetical protein
MPTYQADTQWHAIWKPTEADQWRQVRGIRRHPRQGVSGPSDQRRHHPPLRPAGWHHTDFQGMREGLCGQQGGRAHSRCRGEVRVTKRGDDQGGGIARLDRRMMGQNWTGGNRLRIPGKFIQLLLRYRIATVAVFCERWRVA